MAPADFHLMCALASWESWPEEDDDVDFLARLWSFVLHIAEQWETQKDKSCLGEDELADKYVPVLRGEPWCLPEDAANECLTLVMAIVQHRQRGKEPFEKLHALARRLNNAVVPLLEWLDNHIEGAEEGGEQ
jgi:hypothetical protein